MLREVTIEEYWPLIVKNTAEFQQIAVAENPEFNKLAECIYRVLGDGFIADATEYGVERWEKMLGITPAEGSSLDDRKAAILTQLSVKIPYTWRVLKQMLVPILGGEDKFTMEHFNDTAQLIVHTDRLNDAMLATVNDLLERVLPENLEIVQYNHHIDISWKDINKYAECKNKDDMRAVNAEYGKDVTSDLEWIYPLPSLTTMRESWSNGVFSDYNTNNWIAKKIIANLPICTDGTYSFIGNHVVEEIEIYAPKLTTIYYGITECKNLKKIKGYFPKLSDATRGLGSRTVLEVFDAELPSLSTGGVAFENCKLDKPSTLKILNSIPSYTSGNHPLGIGVHIDHQNDEEVWAAISNAEAKGWTVTVQWNGKPTSGVTTTDLDELWCKVTESENGDYTDENGNRCTLDWGHYVTDTTDYKLFFSLVEAEQYYKLTRIENNE